MSEPFVPKSELLDKIKNIIQRNQTGFLNILTNANKLVVFWFAKGKLTYASCITKNLEQAIAAITECQTVKFTFTQANTGSNMPELMAATKFLQALSAETSTDNTTHHQIVASQQPAIPQDTTSKTLNGNATFIQIFTTLTAEYIGPIADIIVQEAFTNTQTPEASIDYIAKIIPETDQAYAFKTDALTKLSELRSIHAS